MKKELKSYRGFHCSLEEITTKYKEGSFVNLQGFTSTTLERGIDVDFAYNNLTAKAVEQGICPVLIEIKIQGDEQMFFLNSEEFSAYAYEQEILLQDGVEYKVVRCTEDDEDLGKTLNKKMYTVVLEKSEDDYSRLICCLRYLKLLTQ